TWLPFERQPAAVTAATALIIQPTDPCVRYFTAGNKIFKKPTCDQDWQQVYFGPSTEELASIVIDWYNPQILYAGSTTGSVFQSTDSGVSWQSILAVNKTVIQKILIDPRDSRTIYVATSNKGLYRSTDRGISWSQLLDPLKQFNGGPALRDVVINPAAANSLIWASNYGLLKTTNGGESWTSIDLLTPPGTAVIRAVAVDPKNDDGLFYATDNTFYRSLDGGQNWIADKSPSNRAVTALTIDAVNPNVIYLGVSKLTEQNNAL
ncbi:MAG: hypothetical protein AAB817_01645, partial [Patescibacteria group bacterium]